VTLQLEGRWQSRKIAVFMTGRRHAGENLPKSIGPGGMAFAAASPMGHGKPRAPSRGRRFRRPSPFAEHHPPSAGLRLRSRRWSPPKQQPTQTKPLSLEKSSRMPPHPAL